jgi:hypothetical protein
MVSGDGGRQWTQRTPPAAMFELAIDPDDPDRLVASTEAGVFSSADAGKGWRRLRDDIAGLLAWPADDRLYLVDGQGQVQHSATANAAGSRRAASEASRSHSWRKTPSSTPRSPTARSSARPTAAPAGRYAPRPEPGSG